jgi:RimJ/RimL family protein N-acetyltransferase
MRHWTDDPEVTRYLSRGTFPSSLEQMERDYDRHAGSHTEVELAIVDAAKHAHIGVTGLHAINWVARSAEFRILIGDKRCWGQGMGAEATQLIVAYGFERLNLNRVWLGVNQDNTRAVRAYERTGFRVEGVLRQEIYRDGRYSDAVRMSLLRGEYEQVRATWLIAEQLRRLFPGSR